MTKQYTIGQTKQLIDLNDNLINFKIQFKVSSLIPPPNCPVFEVGIIPQSQLNTSPDDIELQQVTNGEFSGEIENNNNVYQSWYLVLKAPEECTVAVELLKEEIAPVPDKPPVQQQETPSSYKTIAIVVIVMVLVGAGWWFYFRKQTDVSSKGSPIPSLSMSGSGSGDLSDGESVFSPSVKFAMSPTSAKILDRIK